MFKMVMKCSTVVVALSMLLSTSVHSAWAEPVSTIQQSAIVTHTEVLKFTLQAGQSMVVLSPPDLRNAISSTTYIHINVHPGERVVLSYERYNPDTGKWEPAYVKVFDDSYHGIFREKDRSQTYRYMMTGDNLQAPIDEYIIVNYKMNQ